MSYHSYSGLGAVSQVDITSAPDIQTAQLAAIALADAKGVLDGLSPPVQIALATVTRGIEAGAPALSALQTASASLKAVQESMDAADSVFSSVMDNMPIIGIFVGFVVDVIKDIFESYQPTIEQRINVAATCRAQLKQMAPSPSGGGLDPCTICPPDYFGHTVHLSTCSETVATASGGYCTRPLIGQALMKLFGDPEAYPNGGDAEFQQLRGRASLVNTSCPTVKIAVSGQLSTTARRCGPAPEVTARFVKIRRALEAMRIQGTLARQGKASYPSSAVAIALWSWLLDMLAQEVWAKRMSKTYATYMLTNMVLKDKSIVEDPGQWRTCFAPVLIEQIFGTDGLYGTWDRTIKPFYSESQAKLADMRKQADALATAALSKPKIMLNAAASKAVIAAIVKKNAPAVKKLRKSTAQPFLVAHPASSMLLTAAVVGGGLYAWHRYGKKRTAR